MRHLWKRTVSLMLACMLAAGSTVANATTGPVGTTDMSIANTKLAKQMELESIVLAQNENSVFPLRTDKPVAVFGNGQIKPSTGGSGSGAANGAYTTNFLDGMDKLGMEAYPELRAYYEAHVSQSGNVTHGWDTAKEAPDEWGTPVYSGTGFSMTAGVATPEVKLDDGEVKDGGLVARAAEACDTAVVFLTRTTGSEEMDRIQQPGDWYLNHSEKVLLEQVSDKFDKVAVIMSVNGSMDMSWVKEYGVDGVMISYAGGSQNGYALAELAFGYANPSGKLADTITETYEEHPTVDSFGYTSYADAGLDFAKNNSAFGPQDPVSLYTTGIFEGHRYFDTFGKDVLYPFGSGLSYSEFAFEDMNVSVKEGAKELTVEVTVANVTENPESVPGKEVAEVYVSAPEGDLEQPYQKLIDFEKTELLASGESQEITFNIPLEDFASYDEEQAAYVLEPGDYYIRVGGSSRSTHVAGCFRVEEELLVEQLSNELVMSEDAKALFEEKALTTKDAKPITYEGEKEEMAAAREAAVTVDASNIDAKTQAPQLEETVVEELPEDAPVYKYSAVVDGTISLPEFVSQMTQDELVMFCSGGATAGIETYYADDSGIRIDNVGTKANIGTSGAGQSRTVERLAIPSMIYADGSAGISYNASESLGLDKNVGWPRAAAVACIWNKDLLKEFGEAVGEEMVAINVDIWLAPSINLHRNPLNGRNNEYYSEDPILSGITAATVATGVNESGVTVCLKHYAGNDQEWYRRGLQNETTLEKGTSLDAMNVISTERALREVTLKPFEMAVKTGAVTNVMSAFNKLNGQYCAASEELLIDILRGEWGFDGFVVTDWGDLDTIADPDLEMAGGNDVIMSGKHVMYRIPDKIVEGLGEKGTVTIEDMQRNAYHFLRAIGQSALSTMEDKHQYAETLEIRTTELPLAKVNREYAERKVNPLIAAGGEGTSYSFSVAQDSKDQLPEGLTLLPNGRITGKAAEGQQGVYGITFQVTDNEGAVAVKELQLTVEGELEIVPEALPIARQNQEYRVELEAKDADGNKIAGAVYHTEDPLPNGITLSEDGVLSGSSQEAEPKQFDIDVQVTAPDGKNGTAHYTLHTIVKSVEVSLEELSHAELNTSYTCDLQAEGGLAPYTWKVKDLPSGFALSGSSIKSGNLMFGLFFIPGVVPESAEGKYEITLIVTDALGESSTRVVPLVVGDPSESQELQIVTGSLEMGNANETYPTVQLKAANAQGDVKFSVDASGDPLPNGLELSEDGKLEGTLASDSSGVYQIVIRVEDGVASVTKTFQLFVKGRLDSDPMPFSVFTAKEGKAFAQEIKALNGPFSTDYTYKLAANSDALPEGLSLTEKNFMGIISGTPAAGTAGTYNLYLELDTQTFAGNPVTSIVPYTLIIKENTDAPEADKTLLNKVIGYAEEQMASEAYEGVHADVKKGFEKALAEAKQIRGNSDATREEVLEGWTNLVKWIHALGIEAVDKSLLAEAIAEAERYDLDRYVEAGKEAFIAALQEAQDVYADEYVTRQEIDAATEKLMDSILELRLKANKTNLEELLKSAKQIDLTKYTAKTAAAVRQAIAEAEAAMADDALSENDQAYVDQLAKNLETTVKELERKTSSSGKTSSSSIPAGNAYGADGTALVTGGTAAQGAYVRSDTTLPFTVRRGQAYCFKMTVVNGASGIVPSFTVGNGNVFKTQFVAQIGNDFYYRVWAIGAPGQSTGVYTQLPNGEPQKHCTVTIG